MSREIKFRVWDIKNKKMEIAWSIDFAGKNYKSIEANEVHTGEYILGVDTQAILMQFTGLKDNNGKEIYEGDIVLGRFILDDVEDYIYLSLTDMERKNQSKTFLIEDISYLYTNPIPEDIEVIGNVFENPELLNEII